jgi:hypothetical protein
MFCLLKLPLVTYQNIRACYGDHKRQIETFPLRLLRHLEVKFKT